MKNKTLYELKEEVLMELLKECSTRAELDWVMTRLALVAAVQAEGSDD